MKRGVLLTISLVLGLTGLGLTGEARAEIVKRELYTNAKGEKVHGYVFQADRRFTRRGRVSYYVPYCGSSFHRINPAWRRTVVIVRKKH